MALEYSKGTHARDPLLIFECLNRDARSLCYLNRMEKKDLFNKFSLDLRRRIDYLSSVFIDEWHDGSDDDLEELMGVSYFEFMETTRKRALIELQALINSSIQFQRCKQPDEVTTIASYLSVREAVSFMKVSKTGLFNKVLSDDEYRGNAKCRKINY